MNIPILKYVDVVVGFSLIMVLISTIVLAITQTILNSTSARTRHLQRSLVRLIRQIQPGPLAAHAPYLAALIVRHPMIGRQTMGSLPRKWLRKLRTRLARRVSAPAVLRTPAAPPPVVVTSEKKKSKLGEIQVETSPPESYGGWVRRVAARAAQKLVGSPGVLPPVVPGSVIQRDELAYILVELAAGEGPLMDPLDDGVVPESVAQAQKVLASALRVNGIEDPLASLRAVRIKALANERAHPEQPAQQWRTAAVVDTAPSDFVGKIHHTFDQVMARSTDGFGVESQIVVTVVALIVAVAMQLDSLVILKRLSLDEGMRQALVEAARGTETAPDVAKARESLALLNSPSIDLFSHPAPPLGLPAVPGTILETLTWPLRGLSSVASWVMVNGFKGGVLLSWLLLSLGAPFWFDMLKNALRLRSILAVKDEADRQARSNATPAATTSTTITTSTATAPASPARTAGAGAPDAGDEAGDLSATGAQG
jgi:hypothetical protein